MLWKLIIFYKKIVITCPPITLGPGHRTPVIRQHRRIQVHVMRIELQHV